MPLTTQTTPKSPAFSAPGRCRSRCDPDTAQSRQERDVSAVEIIWSHKHSRNDGRQERMAADTAAGTTDKTGTAAGAAAATTAITAPATVGGSLCCQPLILCGQPLLPNINGRGNSDELPTNKAFIQLFLSAACQNLQASCCTKPVGYLFANRRTLSRVFRTVHLGSYVLHKTGRGMDAMHLGGKFPRCSLFYGRFNLTSGVCWHVFGKFLLFWPFLFILIVNIFRFEFLKCPNIDLYTYFIYCCTTLNSFHAIFLLLLEFQFLTGTFLSAFIRVFSFSC